MSITYSTANAKLKNVNKENIVEDIIDNSIIIFPNPSSSILNIKGIDNISSFQIKISDLTGKTIISKKPNPLDNNSTQIDISTLPVGIYLLEIENEIDKFTKKIIKN